MSSGWAGTLVCPVPLTADFWAWMNPILVKDTLFEKEAAQCEKERAGLSSRPSPGAVWCGGQKYLKRSESQLLHQQSGFLTQLIAPQNHPVLFVFIIMYLAPGLIIQSPTYRSST